MHANHHLAYRAEQSCFFDTPMDSYHRQYQNGQQLDNSDKEPMFEKPLTPSDVGKLNRLVIPKQYAEKYFPLDAEAGEKGLLLCFEDETGKPWRFRYSYWTSSQSYVLTKGWSRFVKEKQLDAGDVVLFLRLRGTGDHLYIACRRRGAAQDFVAAPSSAPLPQAMATAMLWNPAFCNSAGLPSSNSYLYLDSIQPHAEEQSSEATAATAGNSKRLRLFGVNLECGHLFPASSQVNKASSGHPSARQEFQNG